VNCLIAPPRNILTYLLTYFCLVPCKIYHVQKYWVIEIHWLPAMPQLGAVAHNNRGCIMCNEVMTVLYDTLLQLGHQ